MRGAFVTALLLCAGLGVAACAVDPERLPKTYLLQAQQAVNARDAPTALAALDHAESLWLSVNYRTSFFSYDPEALRDMGNARAAVQTGRWRDAEYMSEPPSRSPAWFDPPIRPMSLDTDASPSRA